MKALPVAVAGLGVGEQHAAAFLRLGARIEAVCDRSPEKLARAARKWPGARRFERFEDLLKSGAEAVSIATHDADHAGQAVRAMEAGVHAFVEKPLARTVAEARAIKAAWRRHGGRVKLASNLVLRAAPLYRWLKSEIARGRLGEVYAFDGDYLYGRLHKITGGWRKNEKGYSVMAGGGIHMIDLMLWLTGQRPARVWAAGNRVSTRGTGFRYDDFAAATFAFPSGLVGRITANFGCVHRHQHVLRVFGTKGTFIHDDRGPRIHRRRDAEGKRVRLASLPRTKGDLIPDFLSAVRKGRDLSRETQSYLDGVCLAAACDRALKSGRSEKVEYA